MAVAPFWFLDARPGKSSRTFSRETANDSPSPWGEGRGEGGRLTIVCAPIVFAERRRDHHFVGHKMFESS